MKLKEYFYLLGMKPSPREYLFDVDQFELPQYGGIQFARWRHPKERRKELRQAEIEQLKTFLAEGDAAIDIGAHTGDTTLPIALAVGPRGIVLALEPNRYVYKVLLANCGLNRDKTNIHPLMFAATEEDGSFEFEYSDPGFCNGGCHDGISTMKHAHFFKLSVAGRNLPRYLAEHRPEVLERLKYIKIDTEGFDHQVVKTLAPILKERRPYLRSEIFRHTTAESREAYFETLSSLDYRLHHMVSEERYRGEVLTAAEMSQRDHFDIFAVPEERE